VKRLLNRRNVLRGAAGFALGLPFLPSLQPRSARAGDPPFAPNPRFVAMATHHGGIWGANMFPADGAGDSMSYVGRTVRRRDLELSVAGGKASVCPVISGSDALLTEALVRKLNVIRGLDHPFYIGHHTGGHLGNLARNDANGSDGAHMQGFPTPTIDQVMAWSESFYPDLSGVLKRAMIIEQGHNHISWNWSSPDSKTGTIEEVGGVNSSLALFNEIFVPEEDPQEQRPPIVDRVLEDYKRLRNGDRRLSAADRQRLDDHLERLEELERRLKVSVSCGDVQVPTADSADELGSSSYGIDPAAQQRFWQLMNDVIVAAFTCGTSRIATMNCGDIFDTFDGDWHQGIAHQCHRPDGAAQATIAAAHQMFFEAVFLDLASKLDAIEEADGVTLLDNTLVHWTQESGAYTHDSISQPVLTAGSAAGFLRTGSYLDYRNLSKVVNGGGYEGAEEITHAGLPYSQWLGNVLQAMGVPASEWANPETGGYGPHYVGEGMSQHYEDATFSKMDEMLPWLKA
jgi:hypothetical protein